VTAPHVPLPEGDLWVAAVFAVLVGGVAAIAISLISRKIKLPFRRAATITAAVVAIATYALVVQTRATDRFFGGYFSFKTPLERFQDHFADFEGQVSKDPEIAKALDDFPEASTMLQDMATRGVPRLDDATLRKRARLMAILLSKLSPRACVCVLHRSTPTDADGREVEHAMLNLGAGFVSEWMQVLYRAMLAEARKSPTPAVSSEEMAGAYDAVEAKIGVEAAKRVSAGLKEGSSDSEYCWAARTIYEVAPTLAEPHATVLLRFMAQAWLGNP
jgi:hypothetical protein